MVTKEQIDEQIELERLSNQLGIQRLKEQTRKLEDKTYASATAYGTATISSLLPVLAQQIKDTTKDRIKKGKPGPYFADVAKHLLGLEPEVIANISLKVLIDHLFGRNDVGRRIQMICSSIGQALEAECQMRWYEQQDPNLMDSIRRNYWHSSSGTRQRLSVSRLMMNRRDHVWPAWDRGCRARIGAWVVSCLDDVCDWISKVSKRHGKREEVFLYPSPSLLAIRNQVMAECENYCALQWPMLIPPKPWTSPTSGGYLLSEVMGQRTVVRGSNLDPCRITKTPLDYLNTLQNVAYRTNRFVVDVAEVLYERRIEVGKFVPVVELPFPPKPADIATNEEARKAYCREAAETMNRNAQVFRRSCRTRAQLDTVRRFKDRDRYYLPWSYDYRSRAYPIASYLTPQDTDFGKALVRFADEATITEDADYWIAFQVATTYGLDKATFNERMDWVAVNNDLIEAVATDPIGNLHMWSGVSEPWQFLAAAEEFYACCITSTRQTTGLPVANDATCSGLQILAGLARDRSTARLVNVIPGDRPSDAYKAVAEEAKQYLPDHLKGVMTRKITKRTVMTIPYNATKHSSRKYVWEAVKETDFELESGDITKITDAVYKAMKTIVPGPLAVMKWLNDEVKVKMQAGQDILTWVTPTGFTVRQKLNKKNVISFDLKLLGRFQMKIATSENDEVDKRRHMAATAPNLIHSLDASVLILALHDCDKPFTTIHDSIMCRATDVGEINQRVRMSYKQLFADQDYLTDFANQIGALTPPPIIGDLDPSEVINSTYFFS
jgi:DNA-directed RNA polymerase